MIQNGHKDALIGVPVAHFAVQGGPSLARPPSPEELCAIYYKEIQDLKAVQAREKEMLQITSSVALGLLRRLVDLGEATEDKTVTVPMGIHYAMDGSTIEVGRNDSGDITVKLIERTE